MFLELEYSDCNLISLDERAFHRTEECENWTPYAIVMKVKVFVVDVLNWVLGFDYRLALVKECSPDEHLVKWRFGLDLISS